MNYLFVFKKNKKLFLALFKMKRLTLWLNLLIMTLC